MRRFYLHFKFWIFFILGLSVILLTYSAGRRYQARKKIAPEILSIDKDHWRTGWMSAFVLPADSINISNDSPESSSLTAISSSGKLIQKGTGTWCWHAPTKPGVFTINLIQLEQQDTMHIQAFVLTPFRQLSETLLNGYKIGNYPETKLRGLTNYAYPKGFIEVTEKNQNTWLSPHFQLKQFLCKQASVPQYIVLRPKLIIKLELILSKLNKMGFHLKTLHIMSGYRTPVYNRNIGNVKYSRHIYGDAADIFIDVDENGLMDDLNKDGQVDFQDAEWLFDQIDAWSDLTEFEPLIGGLSAYPATSAHGPFVHVDTRGFKTRWGD